MAAAWRLLGVLLLAAAWRPAYSQDQFSHPGRSRGGIQTCPRVRSGLTSAKLRAALEDATIPMPVVRSNSIARMLDNIGVDWAQRCSRAGVIGQHFAMDLVLPIVADHLSTEDPGRPLVLIFLGPNGVGKTHFEQLLKRASLQDRFPLLPSFPHSVTISGASYRHRTDASVAIDEILDAVVKALRCPRVFIIFDEVQFFPEGLYVALTTFIGHAQPVNVKGLAVDARKSIFIFTTNVHYRDIVGKATALAGSGAKRKDWPLEPFKELILGTNHKLIRPLLVKGLVDRIVPFLPAGKEEVATGYERILERERCHRLAAGGGVVGMAWSPAVVEALTEASLQGSLFAVHGLSTLLDQYNLAVGYHLPNHIDKCLRENAFWRGTLTLNWSEADGFSPTFSPPCSPHPQATAHEL